MPLNYNRFLDELQFIDAKGDTLSLNNVEDVQLISIGNDTLFYSNGFVKLVSTAGDVKLAMKQTLNLVSKEKVSDGYGSTSSTSAIDVYDSYADQVKNYNIRVMENVILENRVQYFVGDDKNEFVLANKKNLLHLFPKRKHDVESYLKSTAVDFNNPEDLTKLVQYLGGL